MTKLLILSLLLFAGCVSTSQNVAPEIAASIPDDANAIRLYSEQRPDDFYRNIYQELATKGYEIDQSNNEMRTLSTGYRDIGQQTTLALNVFVTENNQGSMAVLRGKWGVSGSFAAGLSAGTGANVDKDVGEPAVWKQRNRSGIAFGEMAMLFNDINHQRLEYIVE